MPLLEWKVLIPLLLGIVLEHDLLLHLSPSFTVNFGLFGDFVWNWNICPEVEVAFEFPENLIVSKGGVRRKEQEWSIVGGWVRLILVGQSKQTLDDED